MNSFFDRTPTPSLPHNFAQNILELEMQMEFEESSTLQVVQQLNELYTQAIEYYISHEDERKLHHFQRKLQLLLSHPHTLQAIQNKIEPTRNRDSKTKTAADYNHILRGEINKFNSESSVLVKSMVEGSQLKLERTNRLLNENIQNQQQRLRKRLASRSKSRNNNRNNL